MVQRGIYIIICAGLLLLAAPGFHADPAYVPGAEPSISLHIPVPMPAEERESRTIPGQPACVALTHRAYRAHRMPVYRIPTTPAPVFPRRTAWRNVPVLPVPCAPDVALPSPRAPPPRHS